MIIENLKIKGLRNLKDRDFSFSPARNLLHGLNGTGKTTILEAIFLCCFGKSFLNVKRADLINVDMKDFSIDLFCKNDNNQHKIRVYYDHSFFMALDEKRTNIVDINTVLFPVFFSSSDYNLYIESKTYTRRLINRFIFGVYPLYIHYILSYNKALKQKNVLLKTRPEIDQLSSWNRIISETGEKIMGLKTMFLEKLNAEIKHKYGSSRDLQIQYRPSLNLPQGETYTQANIFSRLESLKTREIRMQKCLEGPHLDVFDMYLDGRGLRFHSSGEKKMNLLMIYISYIELYKKEKNEYPVFLVDDFDTAIDEQNIETLVENYPRLQVIATSVKKHTRFDHFIGLGKEN